jgi:hypothetical protein
LSVSKYWLREDDKTNTHPPWVSISTLTMLMIFLCSICFIIHPESVFRHWQCWWFFCVVFDKTNITQKNHKHCHCRNTDSVWMIKQTLHRKLINIASVEILTRNGWKNKHYTEKSSTLSVSVLSSSLSQYFDTDNVYDFSV